MKKFGNVVLVLAVISIIGGTAHAQRQRGRGGFGGGLFAGGGTLQLLMRKDVAEEIDLLDDQRKELEEIRGGMREQMREVFRSFRDMSDEERQTAMNDFSKKIQDQVDEVLLPHQIKRVKQIALQQAMRGGTTRMLQGEVAEELGISDDELAKIGEKARAAGAKLQKKIDELRREAQEELLEEILSESQLAKLKKLLGKKFEFDSTEQVRFGRAGAGGGRGGAGN